MKKRLLTFLLLLSMSFLSLHAFVIEALDTHPCSVSEYLHEINEAAHETTEGDICQIHHHLHISFVVPEFYRGILYESHSQNPSSTDKLYEYHLQKNFLKPPINA
jgi:hypothetical protein